MKKIDKDSLLIRGYKNMRVACELFYSHSDDPYYLNMSAYHLQQSVEMTLKYEMEQNGIEFQKTHNITQLIQMIRGSGADIDIPDFIDDASERFTVWEATARYELNNFVEYRKIKDAIPHVREFINEAVRQYDHDFWKENINIVSSRNKDSTPAADSRQDSRIAKSRKTGPDNAAGNTDEFIMNEFIEQEDDTSDGIVFEVTDPADESGSQNQNTQDESQ